MNVKVLYMDLCHSAMLIQRFKFNSFFQYLIFLSTENLLIENLKNLTVCDFFFFFFPDLFNIYNYILLIYWL